MLADAVKLEKDFPTGMNIVFLLKELRNAASSISKRVKTVQHCDQILKTIKGEDKWNF